MALASRSRGAFSSLAREHRVLWAGGDRVPRGWRGTAHPQGPARSTPLSRGLRHSSSGDDERDRQFDLNYGRACDLLRSELPKVLERPLTPSIYSEDLVFDSPVIHLSSLRAYLLALAMLRGSTAVVFRDRTVTLTRVWAPEHGVLRVRCSFTATPRGLGLLSQAKQLLQQLKMSQNLKLVASASTGDKVQLDLLFTYGFNSKGLIDLHRVETVLPIEPPLLRETAAQQRRRAVTPAPQVMVNTQQQGAPTVTVQPDACQQE